MNIGLFGSWPMLRLVGLLLYFPNFGRINFYVGHTLFAAGRFGPTGRCLFPQNKLH